MSLFGDDVQELVTQLERLGASVVYDTFVPGMKPIHYKVAILRGLQGGPVVWLGSMNILAHYGSHELMQRFEGPEIHDRVVDLLRADVLVGHGKAKELAKRVSAELRRGLDGHCPKHQVARVLKRSSGQKRGYFLSCPHWREKSCSTVNVSVDDLNEALRSAGASCPQPGCGQPLSAGYGKFGVWIRCASMHYTDLPSE